MRNPAPRRPYLLRRASTWYLRFRFPSEIQSLVGRNELRLSLRTSSVRLAERRALACHTYLHRLRHIGRLLKVKTLTKDDASRVLSDLFAEMIEELERLEREVPVKQELERREWTKADHEMFGDYDDLSVANVRQGCLRDIDAYRQELARQNYQRVASEARGALERFGYSWDALSPSTFHFCAGLAKQRITFNEVLLARIEGDFRKEEALLNTVRPAALNGVERSGEHEKAAVSVSAAWSEFYKEKTAARPKADWSQNTAMGQQAMIDEFIEIVGDPPINTLSRDVLARYLEVVSRLPKNRKKHYPNQSVQALLAIDLPASQRPSARTVKEKLTQLGAFLKWCREIKGYTQSNPTRGLQIKSESRSYALFSHEDLAALFHSKEYVHSRHRSSWRFWVPLVALYTGARQAEIAQLRVSDIAREDEVDIICISDQGEGQRVKTRAGIRKVPISTRLKSLGFLEYVACLRERGEVRLFPDLPRGSRSAGQKISRWFGDTYRKNCGVGADSIGGRKVFHSFRHTAITKALGAGVAVQYCQQFFGHEQSMLGETATYTHLFSPTVLVSVAEALQWGLDHSRYAAAWKTYLTSD